MEYPGCLCQQRPLACSMVCLCKYGRAYLPPGTKTAWHLVWRSENFKCSLVFKLLSWLTPRSDRHSTLLSICILFFHLPSFGERLITMSNGPEAHPCYWSHTSKPKGMLKGKDHSGIRNLTPFLVWGQNSKSQLPVEARPCGMWWLLSGITGNGAYVSSLTMQLGHQSWIVALLFTTSLPSTFMYIYVESKNTQQQLFPMIICVLIRTANQKTHNILKSYCVRQTAFIWSTDGVGEPALMESALRSIFQFLQQWEKKIKTICCWFLKSESNRNVKNRSSARPANHREDGACSR